VSSRLGCETKYPEDGEGIENNSQIARSFDLPEVVDRRLRRRIEAHNLRNFTMR
jgi:hypothetical protein